MALTAEQLSKRTTYIGGSDAPAVLGLSRWKTPLQVWAEKTGAIVAAPSETLPMKIGTALEPTLRKLFNEETGETVVDWETEFFDKDHPFLGCHVDGLILGKPDEIFEGKTANAFKENEWHDGEIPAEYIIQAQHSLMVTQKRMCRLGVLIGNHNFQVRSIERDDELIADIKKKEVDFWRNYVLTGIMPALIKAGDAPVLYRLFPQEDLGSVIDLGDDGARLIEMRNAICQDLINLEAQRDTAENQIKALLKDKETGLAGGWRVTWKEQIRKSFVVKETKFRKLNVKPIGGKNGNNARG